MKVEAPAKPTVAWAYDDPDYWDPESLEHELRRVGDMDATEREIAGVSMAGFDEVNELCFHCKLCYNHCPYTPPHEWDVDFPQLMRRQQLQRSRCTGTPLARKLTTRTDLIGKVGSMAPALTGLDGEDHRDPSGLGAAELLLRDRHPLVPQVPGAR
jgi:ferredoxin